MRIGICGAQGTGKRLLARMISQKLGLPLIEGTARTTAHEMGIHSEYGLKDLPIDELIDFEKRCLSDQIHSEALHPDGFVTARTVIDSAAYWLSWAHSGAPHDDRLWFVTTARFHAKDYDLIVWSRPYPEAEIEFDGFRINDPLYQREIDILIGTLIGGWGVKPIIVDDRNPGKRVSQVLDAVREMKEAS